MQILAPIQPILWTDLHKTGPGRPVEYNPECDLRALMLRQLLHIPIIKDLSKRLRREPYLRQACGYNDKAPCEAHFSQMKKRIGATLPEDITRKWQVDQYSSLIELLLSVVILVLLH